MHIGGNLIYLFHSLLLAENMHRVADEQCAVIELSIEHNVIFEID